jgi:hypothetical protein
MNNNELVEQVVVLKSKLENTEAQLNVYVDVIRRVLELTEYMVKEIKNAKQVRRFPPTTNN